MKLGAGSFFIVLVAMVSAGCRSPYYADRGAVLGGVTGALAGAAIGNHNGNTGAGALIGTAVGALAGAAIGNTVDADIARNNAMVAEAMGRQMAGAVGPAEAIALTRSGLSDEVIITHIRANGVAQSPQVHDLINMRNNGVSDVVINVMQQTPPPGAQVAVAAPPPTMIVQEHYVMPAPYPPPMYVHRGPPRYYGPPPRVGWGFSYHSRR